MEKIGSKENFVKFIEQYQNLVFSICLKLTGDYFAAEDLTQETFVAAYQALDKSHGAYEKAWICRIASNKCVDYLRSTFSKMIPMGEETEREESTEENDPLRQVMNQELIEELKKCCEDLPPLYREISIRHFLEGKTAKEIAQQSGTGVNTVKTKIYRARELLKKSFGKEMLRE
ncbi:MAG: sigma-70 family RNA polymerase sigma factor [Lachnospiraceae bacterium]|nr:sigma-70 family RNA polymerase sigma factor [Lachnospiraceae bacterium]